MTLKLEIRDGEELQIKELPQTLAAVEAELTARVNKGECVDVVGIRLIPFCDSETGMFCRLIFELADGSSFMVDSNEISDDVRRQLN